MAVNSDIPEKLESVFVQRNSANEFYEQINVSGSDLIFYHDASGSFTADRISVWAARYGLSGSGGTADTASYALTASYLLGTIESASYASTASYISASMFYGQAVPSASTVLIASTSEDTTHYLTFVTNQGGYNSMLVDNDTLTWNAATNILSISGQIVATGTTSSLYGTASWAESASYYSGSIIVPGNDREILINDGGNLGAADGFQITAENAFIYNATGSEPTIATGSTYYNTVNQCLYIAVDDSLLWGGCNASTGSGSGTSSAAPNMISSSLLIWLDAGYATFYTGSPALQGGKVREWDSHPEITGSLNLWATASSGDPSAATLQSFGGLPAILFDEAAGSQYTIYHDVAEAINSATSGSVVWVAATRGGGSMHNLSGYGTDENLYPAFSGLNVWEGFGTTLIKNPSTPSAMASGSGWYVYSVRAENGRMSMRVNGTEFYNTGSGNSFDIYAHSAITFYLGYDSPNGGWWYDGYLGEFTMYAGYVSDSDISSVENYFINKYSIV